MANANNKPGTGPGLSGNVNQLGVMQHKTQSQGNRVGTITHGPGKNKPRVHLVSSKGKIPAEIVAHALANRQAAKSTAVNPQGKLGDGPRTDPAVAAAHTGMPKGVKPYAIKPKTGLT